MFNRAFVTVVCRSDGQENSPPPPGGIPVLPTSHEGKCPRKKTTFRVMAFVKNLNRLSKNTRMVLAETMIPISDVTFIR